MLWTHFIVALVLATSAISTSCEEGECPTATESASMLQRKAGLEKAGLDLHVSASGSDSSGTGSASRPYATVMAAVNKNKAAIEKARQATRVLVTGTIPPPEILSTTTYGGDTRISVNAPNNAPLIITARPGNTARFDGRARISDLKQGAWERVRQGGHGGWIYRVSLKRPVWQLWLGETSLTVARYPNVGRDWFEDWPQTYPLALTSARGAAPATWAKAQGQSPPRNTSYDDYAYKLNGGFWGGWFTTDGGNANLAIEGLAKKNAQWNKNTHVGKLTDSKLSGYDFTGGILHSRLCYKTEFWHPLPITGHNKKTDHIQHQHWESV